MAEEWTNWSGSVTCRPQQIARPENEAEVAALVCRAAAAGQTIRVAGSGHSFTPLCASDDLLLSLEHIAGVEWADTAASRAAVRSGSKIHDLGPLLAQHGLALENQGDVDVQAIAGAVSTGTHGTGVNLGNISTQVVSLRIVTADGEIMECSAKHDRELFRAAQVSLGSLGVITAIELRLLPLYRLHERVAKESLDDCLASLERRVAANRHFEFFWYPADDAAFTKTLNPVAAKPEPAGPAAAQTDSPSIVAPPAEAGLSSATGEREDLSWRIFPTVRENRFNEMEYSLPAERGVECLLEIRDLMQRKHPDVVWPIEYRTQAADDIWISPASGRATVAISIHQAAALPYAEFFADAELIFRRHHGRPHWGKIHSLGCRELRALYPDWDKFQAIRARLDPQGRFLNAHLRRLLLD